MFKYFSADGARKRTDFQTKLSLKKVLRNLRRSVYRAANSGRDHLTEILSGPDWVIKAIETYFVNKGFEVIIDDVVHETEYFSEYTFVISWANKAE